VGSWRPGIQRRFHLPARSTTVSLGSLATTGAKWSGALRSCALAVTPNCTGLMSLRIVNALADLPSTDVFIMSHGWRADVASAKRQYAAWIDAMLACTDDPARM
jgi:hypothetical protein